jgi:hypothetical protein
VQALAYIQHIAVNDAIDPCQGVNISAVFEGNCMQILATTHHMRAPDWEHHTLSYTQMKRRRQLAGLNDCSHRNPVSPRQSVYGLTGPGDNGTAWWNRLHNRETILARRQ